MTWTNLWTTGNSSSASNSAYKITTAVSHTAQMGAGVICVPADPQWYSSVTSSVTVPKNISPIPKQSFYEEGYEDGLNGVRRYRKGEHQEYDMGLADGEGDAV